MIGWGDERLAQPEAWDIHVRGISVGSLRYAKAALMLAIRRREQDREDKAKQGWPHTALRSLDDSIERIRKIAATIQFEPSDVLWELTPRDAEMVEQETVQMEDWDVFISHAHEDKDDFARPLAEGLRARGLSVWFDEFTFTVGDSLHRSIDRGQAPFSKSDSFRRLEVITAACRRRHR